MSQSGSDASPIAARKPFPLRRVVMVGVGIVAFGVGVIQIIGAFSPSLPKCDSSTVTTLLRSTIMANQFPGTDPAALGITDTSELSAAADSRRCSSILDLTVNGKPEFRHLLAFYTVRLSGRTVLLNVEETKH